MVAIKRETFIVSGEYHQDSDEDVDVVSSYFD
jgi:hypothetical protein